MNFKGEGSGEAGEIQILYYLSRGRSDFLILEYPQKLKVQKAY